METASYGCAYEKATTALTPLLSDLPGIIIAIDGRRNAGKTTLGRYLGCHFNVSLIETDLLMLDHGFHYNLEQLERMINRRLNMERPVIVEGVAILKLLESVRRASDFTIYCINPETDAEFSHDEHVSAYETVYSPREVANLLIEISHD